MTVARAKKAALIGITEINHAELAVRLIEIGCHMRRPVGMTGEEALLHHRQAAVDGKVPAYIVKDFEDMATAAVAYFGECITKMQAVQ